MTAMAKARRLSKDTPSECPVENAGNGQEAAGKDSEPETETSSVQPTCDAADPAADRGPERQQGKPYGYQWDWDENAKDYIHTLEDGSRLLYTVYQRAGGDISKCIELQNQAAKNSSSRPSSSNGESQADDAADRARDEWRAARKEWTKVSEQHEKITQTNDQNLVANRPLIVSSNPTLNQPQPPPPPTPPHNHPSPPEPMKKHFEEALDPRFQIVEKPKRFFTVGRIFKTVWFEPYGADTPARRSDLEWMEDECKPFYGTKPLAKFRWFVVVRKRLNHSLCFSITTFGGPGSAAKTRRGRAVDFVVLHSSEVEPPKPYDEEQITRDPLGMIIEEEDQYISPLARLDCGRIYTVEDNLQVMKIGRIHSDSLSNLHQYFRESVA